MNIYKGNNNELIYDEICKSFSGKVELIDSKIICSISDSINHNKITIGLSRKIQDFLFGKSCEVYSEQMHH